MKPLLHIAADERFIDRGIALFEEALPNENVFWVWSRRADGTLEHVRAVNSQNGRVVAPEDKWWTRGFVDWNAFRGVVCHNLYSHPQLHFANKVPKNLPLYWMFFGAEYYNDPNFYKEEAVGPRTRELPRRRRSDRSHNSLVQRIASYVKSRFSVAARARCPRASDKRAAFDRATCFATHLPNEYELIKQSLRIDPLWLNFSYYTIEDYVSADCDDAPKRQQLMLGNSATASNNHVEALDLLHSIGYPGDILCPLSYGDDTYKAAILAEGAARFGERFRSIENYLPFDEYSRRVAESSAMVLNHFRQQALGNIITALWFGTRVFISRRSPALPYFQSLGCVIHSIEDDLKSASQLAPLNAEETRRNRSKLSAAYAKSTFVESIRKMDRQLSP